MIFALLSMKCPDRRARIPLRRPIARENQAVDAFKLYALANCARGGAAPRHISFAPISSWRDIAVDGDGASPGQISFADISGIVICHGVMALRRSNTRR